MQDKQVVKANNDDIRSTLTSLARYKFACHVNIVTMNDEALDR
jgi:hypothetical protein